MTGLGSLVNNFLILAKRSHRATDPLGPPNIGNLARVLYLADDHEVANRQVANVDVSTQFR